MMTSLPLRPVSMGYNSVSCFRPPDYFKLSCPQILHYGRVKFGFTCPNPNPLHAEFDLTRSRSISGVAEYCNRPRHLIKMQLERGSEVVH